MRAPELATLGAVARRKRAQMAFRGARVALLLSVLLALGLALTGYRQGAFVLCALPTLGAAVLAIVPRRGERALAARSVDQHYGLKGLLQSAEAFERKPAEARRPFEAACLSQGRIVAKELSPRAVAPLPPSLAPVLLGSLAAALLVAVCGSPPGRPPTSAPEVAEPSVALAPPSTRQLAAELEAVALRLEAEAKPGHASALALALHGLAFDLRAGRTAELQALSRLDALADEANAAEVLSGIAELSQSLSDVAELAGLGDAVAARSPAAVTSAGAALEDLVKRASPSQLQKLSKELSALRKQLSTTHRSKSLLRPPNAEQPAAKDRDDDLNRLQQRLARAAAALTDRDKDPSRDLEGLTRSLESLARHARDAAEQQNASNSLRQLAERTRRGDGQAESSTDGGGGPGQATQGKQSAIEAFLKRAADPQQSQPGQQPAEGPALAPIGNEASNPGKGPDGPVLGAPEGSVESSGAPSRVRAEGAEGPSRSHVIAEVAAKGVRSTGYGRVHAEYSAHAMDQLEKAPLSTSDRYVVRRYFNLIRPQERP